MGEELWRYLLAFNALQGTTVYVCLIGWLIDQIIYPINLCATVTGLKIPERFLHMLNTYTI